MEAVDHSQLSGAMLAFLWEEFAERARVPAEAVDIVLRRLGLSLDSSGQQLRPAHERWSTPDGLITLEDFLSLTVPVINDGVRSANAEGRELTGFLGELQEGGWPLGVLLCQYFSEMLPSFLFFEPDTIPMSDGRDGGDGSGTLTGPMTNTVIIDGGTGVPETTEEDIVFTNDGSPTTDSDLAFGADPFGDRAASEDPLIRMTPWPCARCNREPIDTVWRPLDGTTAFDTEERICASCGAFAADGAQPDSEGDAESFLNSF